jgi:hypothetical protein
VRLLVDPVEADLRRQRDQRGGVGLGVGNPELQVDRPGPEGGRTDARAARQPAGDLGHERGGLLVAGEDVADRRAAQGVDEVDVLLAGDTEDEPHALRLQAVDEQVGGGRG